ncbi:MAG: hypothetical protein IJG48_06250 [Mogibacterium sp.]|nr:hypothetical protein [Mogibacterium sp.]
MSNIMTVLGTVIDGFVVSNMMDETARAAAGLVSPAIILFAAVGMFWRKASLRTTKNIF